MTRGDPSEDELEYSAEGICSNKQDDPVKMRLKQYFKPLSEAYIEICKKQKRQFFGLRDFYRLVSYSVFQITPSLAIKYMYQ